jgi:hypothetical protein
MRLRTAVDKVLRLEIRHASSDLGSHVDELRQAEIAALSQKNKLNFVSCKVEEKYFAKTHRVVEVIKQAAVLHELGHNVDGLVIRAHGVQLFDTRVSRGYTSRCHSQVISIFLYKKPPPKTQTNPKPPKITTKQT